jgi:hypothetical protein
MLFTSAKISHLANLPQGQVERRERAANMVRAMDELGSLATALIMVGAKQYVRKKSRWKTSR